MKEQYFKHHGILGMHWGVRRYQNPDGSLTEAEKKRYAKNVSNYLKSRKSPERSKDYDEISKVLNSNGADQKQLQLLKSHDDKIDKYIETTKGKNNSLDFINAVQNSGIPFDHMRSAVMDEYGDSVSYDQYLKNIESTANYYNKKGNSRDYSAAKSKNVYEYSKFLNDIANEYTTERNQLITKTIRDLDIPDEYVSQTEKFLKQMYPRL